MAVLIFEAAPLAESSVERVSVSSSGRRFIARSGQSIKNLLNGGLPLVIDELGQLLGRSGENPGGLRRSSWLASLSTCRLRRAVP